MDDEDTRPQGSDAVEGVRKELSPHAASMPARLDPEVFE